MYWFDEASAFGAAAFASTAAVMAVQALRKVVIDEEEAIVSVVDLDPSRIDAPRDLQFRIMSAACACLLFGWVYYALVN